jgi:hypothetical protein
VGCEAHKFMHYDVMWEHHSALFRYVAGPGAADRPGVLYNNLSVPVSLEFSTELCTMQEG